MAARPSIYRQNTDLGAPLIFRQSGGAPGVPTLFRRHFETVTDIDSVSSIDELTDVDNLQEPE